MKQTVDIQTTVGFEKVVFDKATENHVLFKMTGGALEADTERAPLTIIALLDVSTSMAPECKIGYLRKSMVKLIDNLREGDQLCMITYASNVAIVFELTNMNAVNKNRATAIASNLNTSGTTNISGAVSTAYDVLKKIPPKKDGRVIRTILFTDGCPTAGNTSPDVIKTLCANVPLGQITTMGYGKEISDKISYGGMSGELDVVLLQAMAEVGKGNYYYMKDPDSCSQAFAFELAGLLSIVAQDVEITVPPSKHFDTIKVLDDVESETTSNGTVIRLPDIVSEEERFVILGVKTKHQSQAFPRVAKTTVKVSYANPEGERVVTEVAIPIQFVKEGKESTEQHEDVKTHLAVLASIDAQAKAVDYAAMGNFTAAVGVIHDAAAILSAVGTERGTLYAAEVNSLCDSLVDETAWQHNQNDYRTAQYSMTRGRSAGGEMFATKGMKAMAADFKGGNLPNSSFEVKPRTSEPDVKKMTRRKRQSF